MKIRNILILITKFMTVKNYIMRNTKNNSSFNKIKSVNAMCLCDLNVVLGPQEMKTVETSNTSENNFLNISKTSTTKTYMCYDHDNQTCANYLKNVLNSVFKNKIKPNSGAKPFFSVQESVKIYECSNFSILFFPFQSSQKKLTRLLIYVILKNEKWNLNDLWKHLNSLGVLNFLDFYKISRNKFIDLSIPIPNVISLVNKSEMKNSNAKKGIVNLWDNLKKESDLYKLKKKLYEHFRKPEKVLRVSSPYMAFICNESDGKIRILFMDDNK
ncbi:hypothetical protein NBO_60g0020 [Nosema bombycis CQ1]|uniref:Uncharacterized protein n=1 Tax=Nosema bombycis (strain CQ1 / CVCC 102059) TaxID=578461 RepID=R0M6Y2_NOSB1|nr:hypothetical protein NBO_60g0020 [Nosema bombycis CQ1]|eukprot:EOB13764.1 hypothetical protein NBO_60g0020 [Nosema bombycis CQ1]